MHRPIDYLPGIMHGHYQFANVMFRHCAPGRLAATVDWEMGTVGDPKLDLGWVVHTWPEDTSSGEGSVGSYVDMRDMRSRWQVLDHYAKLSGRQGTTSTTIGAGQWKLTIIFEQGYQRAGIPH